MAEVGIGPYISRVLAAQFQPRADKAPGGGALDHGAAGHRAGEGDMPDLRCLDQPLGVIMGEMQVLENARRQAGPGKGFDHALGAQRGLRGVLEQHAVARQQGRQHRVDRGEIRVIPRRDDQRQAQGLAADQPGETGLVRQPDIGQGLFGDVGHVAGALDEAANLSRRVANGPAHHPAELFGQLRLANGEGGYGAAGNGGALGHRGAFPGVACRIGPRHCRGNLRSRSPGPLDIDGIVDGRAALQQVDHREPPGQATPPPCDHAGGGVRHQ
ncbi:hypothetical protein D9M71_550780 [compost metagenome]